ncbi:MAG TPA: hypothetical protein VK843_02795 [Planctomycetota bacterium]|nr:hypothetical protein [Planctomycetota bacterium]
MKLIQSVPWLASTSLLLLAALPSATFPGSVRAADELSYHSVKGLELEKHFVQHSSMKLVELKLTVETPDGPQEPEIELPETTITDDENLEFVEETLAAGEGRPAKLARSFATVENSVTFEGGEGTESNTLKNESGLSGKKVVFSWDEDSKEFEAKWAEGEEGDDDLLGDLVEDADFRGWLPDKKTEEGATWTIPASEFNNLQEPSGPMGYRPEGAEEEDEDEGSNDLRDNVKGEINATYKGTREVDGVKVGVIAFEGKLDSQSESEQESEEGPPAKTVTENSVQIEGELLWDLSAGHFHALTCDSEFKLTTSTSKTLEFGEQSFDLKEVRGFEGKKTYRFTCAAKKD